MTALVTLELQSQRLKPTCLTNNKMSNKGRRPSFGDEDGLDSSLLDAQNGYDHDWYDDQDDVFGFDKDGDDDLVMDEGGISDGNGDYDLLMPSPATEKKKAESAPKAEKPARKPLTPLVSSPYENFNAVSPVGMMSVPRLNVMSKNGRNFHQCEIVLHLSASLNDLAQGKKLALLHLEPEFSGFELPGEAGKGRKTHMHAQGRIELLGSYNKFPVAIGLIASEDLRGSAARTVHSSAGVTCHHIAMADEKVSYDNNSRLVAHSDLGDLTEKYARDYGKFLKKDSIRNSVKQVQGKKAWAEVQVGSPVFGAINASRKKLREDVLARIKVRHSEGEIDSAKDNADRAEAAEIKDLDDKTDHARATGFVYAPTTDAANAVKLVRRAFATHVNYVPLYEAFKFKLVRANVKDTKNGVKEDKS